MPCNKGHECINRPKASTRCSSWRTEATCDSRGPTGRDQHHPTFAASIFACMNPRVQQRPTVSSAASIPLELRQAAPLPLKTPLPQERGICRTQCQLHIAPQCAFAECLTSLFGRSRTLPPLRAPQLRNAACQAARTLPLLTLP